MSSRKVHINELPSEMLLHIFTFLPHLEDRQSLSLICRRWNELAFDYKFLGQIVLHVTIRAEKQLKISRSYRNIHLWCSLRYTLDEKQIENLLTSFAKPSSSVESFACSDTSRDFVTLKLLSVCPHVKKLTCHFASAVPDDKLPVLENVEELVFRGTSEINIISLAPKLRRLEISGNLHDLPTAIQKLPLEHLRIDSKTTKFDLFQYCSTVTKLTSVKLCWWCLDQNLLEQLCEFCPFLIKLGICVSSITTSLRCLASLAHLKVLSIYNINNKIFANNDVCLSNVEVLEFRITGERNFNNSMQRMFPNVRYLKLWHITTTEKISVGFPHLRTIEFVYCIRTVIYELLEGFSNLQELIVYGEVLSYSHLPSMNGLRQLTLEYSGIHVPNNAKVTKFPNLQFLNLFGSAQFTNLEKLPSRCTVRRYLQNRSNELFDVKINDLPN